MRFTLFTTAAKLPLHLQLLFYNKYQQNRYYIYTSKNAIPEMQIVNFKILQVEYTKQIEIPKNTNSKPVITLESS